MELNPKPVVSLAVIFFGVANAAVLPSLVERLHYAIEKNDIETIREVIALGADPNAIYQRRNALHVACLYKHGEVIQYLLDAGANITENTMLGFFRTGNEEYTEDDIVSSLRVLLENGASYSDDNVPKGYLLPVMMAGDNQRTDRLNQQVKQILRQPKNKIP